MRTLLPDRAAFAAELANMQHGSNRYGQKVEGQICPSIAPVTLDESASMLSVSRRAVVSAKAVMSTNIERRQLSDKQRDHLAAALLITMNLLRVLCRTVTGRFPGEPRKVQKLLLKKL
jgi:hypothetical protein